MHGQYRVYDATSLGYHSKVVIELDYVVNLITKDR
jgi:hypothetical protein